MHPCDKGKAAQFDYSRLDGSFAVLSRPAQRALINSGIYTTNDLSKWKRAEVAKLHGIGPSALPKLDRILNADGLEFTS